MPNGVTSTETYDQARIFEQSILIADGYKFAALRLAHGETAWNPTSTKPEKVLRGPLALTYLIHPSGVNVQDYPDDGRCTAHAQPGNVRCTNATVADTIRCGEHQITARA